MPFTGPEFEQLILTQTPAHDRSPTFVKDRFLIFERREGEQAPPGLWAIDLKSDLTARSWSPEGEQCGAPSVSPDGKWLAHETPNGDDPTSMTIALRRLDPDSPRLVWPTEEQARLERGEGSLRGVVWSKSSRFVYTHELEDGRVLMLHDLTDPGAADRELFRVAKRDLDDTGPFPVCFSPEGDRVLIADRHDLHTLVLDGEGSLSTQTLDCGYSRTAAWLEDDSILLVRGHTWEASPRLYRLAAGQASRVTDLEAHLIGGFTDLAASPDRSMLALGVRVDKANAAIASPADDTLLDLQLRYSPAHPVWSPDGRVVYSGDTGRGRRLNIYDPETGSDEPLEIELPFLVHVDDPYQLDQLGFSQNGQLFVFRARYEPANNRCDPQEWIVTTPWPPGSGEVVAIPMEGRNIAFPHVTDDGDRVLWYEDEDGQSRIFGADVEDGRLVRLEERLRDVDWPARLSGDGLWIAAPTTLFTIRITDWDGVEIATLGGPGVSGAPEWLPQEESEDWPRLGYFHARAKTADRFNVRAISLGDPENIEELGSFPLPSPDHREYLTYDAKDRRVVYALRRVSGGNIWLIRPKT